MSVEGIGVDKIERHIGLDGGKFCEPESSFLWDQSPNALKAVQKATLQKVFPPRTFQNICK